MYLGELKETTNEKKYQHNINSIDNLNIFFRLFKAVQSNHNIYQYGHKHSFVCSDFNRNINGDKSSGFYQHGNADQYDYLYCYVNAYQYS